MTTAELDFPPIDTSAPAPAQVAQAPTPPATVSKRSELALLDMKEVALAKFGDWRPSAQALVKKFENLVFDTSTSKGVKELSAAIADVRAPRFAAQNVDKEFASEVTRVRKAVGAEKDAIIEFLAPTEQALVQQKEAHEAREAEKARLEQERKDRHAAAIQRIHSYAAAAQGLPSERIAAGIAKLEAIEVGTEQFEEFAGRAASAKEETLAALRGHHARALEQERIQQEHAARELALQAMTKLSAVVAGCVGQSAAEIEAQLAALRDTVYSEGIGQQVLDAHENAIVQLQKHMQAQRNQEAMAARLAEMEAAAQQRLAAEQKAAEERAAIERAEADYQQGVEAEEPAPAEAIAETETIPEPTTTTDAPVITPATFDEDPFTQPWTFPTATTAAPAPAITMVEPAPAVEVADVLREALELSRYAAAPFFGKFPSHPKTTPEWWAGLRELIEAIQPRLEAAIETLEA